MNLCIKSIKSGFHIEKKPIKYTTRKSYWHDCFKKLTPLEAIVYIAYQVYSLREIAKIIKKSHTAISQIYSRAYDKLHFDNGVNNI
jgi:hypothetical protein